MNNRSLYLSKDCTFIATSFRLSYFHKNVNISENNLLIRGLLNDEN
ncbi:hypothetical protein EMIT079MI2_90163 [Bacillus sp. IT-79MI2]